MGRDELPHLRFRGRSSETVRYFPDRQPIGVDADGRTHVFTYLLSRDVPVDFRPFLRRHAALLRGLPRWTVRLLVPRHLTEAVGAYETAWREELGSPLRLSTAHELRWYFEQRARLANGKSEANGRDETRYARARDAFGAPRYRVLYRSWLQHGPAVLNEVVSPVLADAIARGTGRLETREQIASLSPSRPPGDNGVNVQKGDKRGDRRPEVNCPPCDDWRGGCWTGIGEVLRGRVNG